MSRMFRYTLPAAAGVVSLVLVTGCIAGGLLYHDRLICRTFANAIAHPSRQPDPFANAITLGRKAALRPGYLSRRLARDLAGVTSGECNRISPAVRGFEADCRAAGIKGAVWPEPYAPSCG